MNDFSSPKLNYKKIMFIPSTAKCKDKYTSVVLSKIPVQTKLKKEKNSKLIRSIKQSIIDYSTKKRISNTNPTISQTKNSFQQSKSTKAKNSFNKKELQRNLKYEKYNTSNLLYKLSNDYDKVEFDSEGNFLSRMNFYATKKLLKDQKLNELAKKFEPRIDDDKKTETFNRLIDDANRRNENRMKQESIITTKPRPRSAARSYRKEADKKWNEVYNERFLKKINDYKKNVEEMRNEKETKEKEENKKFEMQKQRFRKVSSEKEIKEIIERLYYIPHLKRMEQELANEKLKGDFQVDCETMSTTKPTNRIPKPKGRGHSKSSYKDEREGRRQEGYGSASKAERIIDEFFLLNSD